MRNCGEFGFLVEREIRDTIKSYTYFDCFSLVIYWSKDA